MADDDDAAKIINDASDKPSGIEVKGVDPHRAAKRDPWRVVEIAQFYVPPGDSPKYPKGAYLWVSPKQIDKHKELFPHGQLVEIYRVRGRRALKPTDVQAVGHGEQKLGGRHAFRNDD